MKIAIDYSMQFLHLIGIVMFYVMIKIRILRKVNQSQDRYHECYKCIRIQIGYILLFSSCYIYIYTSLAILLPKYKFFVTVHQHQNEFIQVSSLKLCCAYIIMHVKMSYYRKLQHHITTQQTSSSSFEDSKERQLNLSKELNQRLSAPQQHQDISIDK